VFLRHRDTPRGADDAVGGRSNCAFAAAGLSASTAALKRMMVHPEGPGLVRFTIRIPNAAAPYKDAPETCISMKPITKTMQPNPASAMMTDCWTRGRTEMV
jgi:hypothetical protein